MKKSVLTLALTTFTMTTLQYAHAHARADGHAPAGVMYEHMHQAGDFMMGYNVQRLSQDGAYYHGSHQLAADSDLLSPYNMLTNEHDMYMHMLHLMYAPTDHLSLMLMPMYMRMDMGMSMNSYASHSNHGAHGGSHQNMAHTHTVKGWGDTILSASYRAFENEQHQVITTLALSAPTGDYKKMGSDGKPVHYGMQLGAGLWQALPSVTYIYTQDQLKLGAQVATRQPLFDDLNDLGYYTGDQRSATAWASYLWNDYVSTSLRMQYQNTDSMQGHYQGSHNHSAAADIQTNYGGEQTFAGIGVNTLIPSLANLRVAAEYMKPVHENLNGVQQRTNDIWNISISKAF